MKKAILFMALSTMIYEIAGAQISVEYSKLVVRNGIYYQVNSQIPFTGKVYRPYSGDQGDKLEGYFLNGRRNGKWTIWYDNGQKQFEGTYKNGSYDSKISKWGIDGQLSEECFYSNGVLNGSCKMFYYNGKTKFNGSYIMGQYDGLIYEYSDDGTLAKSAKYNNGVLNGDYWEEPSQGNRVKCVYKDGNLNGRYIEYHYTGKPAFYGDYVNGLREGNFVYNYPDGNLEKRVNYIHGLKEGKVIFYSKINESTYSPDQKELGEVNYINDNLNGKYIVWALIGKNDVNFLSDESNFKIDPPTWNETYKIEGCYVNGNPDGIFKFYYLDGNILSTKNSTNIYSRKIFDNGTLIDDGWIRDGGWVVLFKANGDVTETSKIAVRKYPYGDRFTKKYYFSCERGETSQIETDQLESSNKNSRQLATNKPNYTDPFNNEFPNGEYYVIDDNIYYKSSNDLKIESISFLNAQHEKITDVNLGAGKPFYFQIILNGFTRKNNQCSYVASEYLQVSNGPVIINSGNLNGESSTDPLIVEMTGGIRAMPPGIDQADVYYSFKVKDRNSDAFLHGFLKFKVVR